MLSDPAKEDVAYPEDGAAPTPKSSRVVRQRPRRWESRLIKQKTLSGYVLVRKWVTDEEPGEFKKVVIGETAAVSQPFRTRKLFAGMQSGSC